MSEKLEEKKWSSYIYDTLTREIEKSRPSSLLIRERLSNELGNDTKFYGHLEMHWCLSYGRRSEVVAVGGGQHKSEGRADRGEGA